MKWDTVDAHGAKLEPGRPHDCRRTIATGLAEMGVATHVGEHALGHAMPRILAIYNRHDYLSEQRIALNAWAEHIDDVIAGRTAKVVAIRAVVGS
jgi:integrase